VRLRDRPITSKLIGIVVVFLVSMSLVLAAVALAFRVTSGVRAYINGEGLFSKGQKDAVISLVRYVKTRDEADYRGFITAIVIPLGDRRARLELLKDQPDEGIATEGLIAGGNSPEDIPQMIFLFRQFSDRRFFSEAIRIWGEAVFYIEQLQKIGAEIHEAIAAGPVDEDRARVWLDHIDQINLTVSALEKRFSSVLGEGAHAVQALLFVVIVIASLLLVAFGLLISYVIAADLRASIEALREGAEKVAIGDLTHRIPVRSRDELGELAAVFNDMIARRRDAEIALLAANEFREKVMESSSNAIYTLDPEGRFTTANRRTGEITGYDIEELMGLPWASLVEPEYLPELQRLYNATIEDGTPVTSREVPLKRRDGTRVHISFSLAALSRAGTIFGVVGVAEDISDRKRAEIELQARAEELVRSNRELEQFAYVASHDLQEPLRTVAGFAQLLAKRYEGKLGADADEYIKYVTSGAQRMKSLIEDLLAYSRVTRAPVEPEVIELDETLAAALANLRGATEAAGATMEIGKLPALRANPRQMTQLFQNLIGNAVKFRRDDVAPTIKVGAVREGEEWHLTIEDNGIGIAEKHIGQVFGLFQRLHGRDKYAGNGIGLTICKKIVDLHRGRIWIGQAEPGPGTVFHIVLPA
jgi:PAS domain S-box-containing protein